MARDRGGRSVKIPKQFREHGLQGTAGWEEKMAAVGVKDGLGIAQALATYLGRIEPRYRCVLVDEAQDVGNLELENVRRLVTEAENDLFLCGDSSQAVTTK